MRFKILLCYKVETSRFCKIFRSRPNGWINKHNRLLIKNYKVATASQTALSFVFRYKYQNTYHLLVCSFSLKMTSIFRVPFLKCKCELRLVAERSKQANGKRFGVYAET